MTMDIGLRRIGLTDFAGLPKLAGKGAAGFAGRPESGAAKYFRTGFVCLTAVLIAGFGAWTLLSGSASKTAESNPVILATAIPEPVQPPDSDAAGREFAFNPATAEAIAPVEKAPVDGLKISSQSWRRGGLGSKALITFTLRNLNDYAVKDIEVFCSFARRDGTHLTDRTRIIHDTINMKGRKTFARMHVGFVNINADRAKCSLIAASHI
jgi:hypothetical protein